MSWWFVVSLLVPLIHGEQHILLDSTVEPMLNWFKYPDGPQMQSPGWYEESFTNYDKVWFNSRSIDKGINWRSYVVCDVPYQNVNNWLRTPFIERGNANRIYIEIKFSMRNCDLFPGTALQCKETFSLLSYDSDEVTHHQPQPWEPESYQLIDRIAADEGRFTTMNDDVIINTETRSVGVNKKGIYFAFRDQGACLSLLAIKVYYKTCPEIKQNLALYPETPTGMTEASTDGREGQCVANSIPMVDKPFSFCKSDGTWLYTRGGCDCMAGYELEHGGRGKGDKQECLECPIGKYKAEPGEQTCSICPPHSKTLIPGSVECRCMEGFYRSLTDIRSTACTRPPTRPRNLIITKVGSSTVTLSWAPPKDEGGRTDTVYRVDCHACGASVKYQSDEDTFPQTFVKVTGLSPMTAYKFFIYSENGVTSVAWEKPQYAVITVTVNPTTVTALYVKSVHSHSIELVWNPPNDPYTKIEMYEVRYFISGSLGFSDEENKNIITKNEELFVGGLVEKTEYGLQVRAKTVSGIWGEFSQPIYEMTRSRNDPWVYMKEAQGPTTSSIVGVVISVIILLLIVTGITLYLKKGNNKWSEKKELFRKMSSHYKAGFVHSNNGGTMPLFNSFTTQKTYIDPQTYEDPHQAVGEFTKELDPRLISIEAIIGGGEFGDVCRGKLSQPECQLMLVAVKTLKPGSCEKAKADFFIEASIMGQFKHPNVIFLQGVVTKATPIMIITEFMENGSLDAFLMANDGKFQVMQLISMMRGIAYGMQYLAEMNYVHRDLAARNVLVNSQLVCKIADFGLSREISENSLDGAYTTKGGKIPVRWTAPEAIAFRKFTSASDGWAFGIVMWEIMSYGERPYWNWSNQDVIRAIEKGYRLPAPMDCPVVIHQLMLDCWKKERADRPTFGSIVKTIDKLICCPESLGEIVVSQAANFLAHGSSHFVQFSSVDDWLLSLNMSRFSDIFASADIITMDQVTSLGLNQLVELGITLVSHQKKINNSIQQIQAQKSVNLSNGFIV